MCPRVFSFYCFLSQFCRGHLEIFESWRVVAGRRFQRNPIKGLPLEREWSKALPCPSREMKTNGTAPTVLNREPARCRYCCWLWPVYERKEEKAQESWATTPSRHLEKETIKRRRLASIILEVGTDGDILLTENLDYLYPLMAVDPFSEDFLDVNSLVDEA